MSNKMFMRVEDVAEEMGVSVSYAYKLIRKLNKELQSTGCITIPGRIDRKFFHEKFYSTKTIERSDYKWQHLKMKKTELGMCSSVTQTGKVCDSKN